MNRARGHLKMQPAALPHGIPIINRSTDHHHPVHGAVYTLNSMGDGAWSTIAPSLADPGSGQKVLEVKRSGETLLIALPALIRVCLIR